MSQDDDNLDNPEQSGGKISRSEAGVGAPTPDDVRQRAEELAAIDGLRPQDVDDRYLDQAREELIGDDILPDDVLPAADEMEARDETPGERGHHVPNVGVADEQTAGEKLYTEGMEEALHDEMREGGKKLDRESRGLEAGDGGDRD